MKLSRGYFLPVAAVLAALPAALPAHPLDNASVWVLEGKAGEGEVIESRVAEHKPPEKTSRPPLSVTVFSEGGARQVTLDDTGKSAARPTAMQAQTQAQLQSQSQFGQQAGSAWEGRATWTISLAARRETLDFNIGVPSGPNVLSELEWDVNMGEVRLNGDWRANNGFSARVELAYASGFAGEVRDSDYIEDNRQSEFSRSYSKSRGSTLGRASLGLGWRLPWKTRVGVTPMLGYAYQQHTLRARHGFQTLWIDPDTGIPGNAGPIHDLDSSYSPRWHGPWLGLKFDASIGNRFEFHAAAKRQWFDYHAEADWNLRSAFAHPVSYTHDGESQGWALEVSSALRLSPQSAITFGLDWHKQRLRNGRDRIFFADSTQVDSRLNGVNWNSWAASLGYRMDF